MPPAIAPQRRQPDPVKTARAGAPQRKAARPAQVPSVAPPVAAPPPSAPAVHPAPIHATLEHQVSSRAAPRPRRRAHSPLHWSWMSGFLVTLLLGQLVSLLWLRGRALAAAHRVAALDVSIARASDQRDRTLEKIAVLKASPRIAEWARERRWTTFSQDKLDDIRVRTPIAPAPNASAPNNNEPNVAPPVSSARHSSLWRGKSISERDSAASRRFRASRNRVESRPHNSSGGAR